MSRRHKYPRRKGGGSPEFLIPPRPLISLIIPVLNEAAVLSETLAGLPAAPDLEVILVDGGSSDGTWEAAADFARVRRFRSPPGRGRQMNAGALASRGELLAFLHADTAFTAAHLTALRRAGAAPGLGAGAFELALNPARPALRFIAWGANVRSRAFGLPYGDQVLWVRRDLFFQLGGYAHRRPEDLDLVLRLRRHTRLKILTPPVVSSGRRWLEHGYFNTTLRHWADLALHLAQRTFTRGWPDFGEMAGEGRVRAGRDAGVTGP